MLMSTGVLSIVILLYMSMPTLISSASATATAELPSLFSTLRSWLRPPYLYFIINAIILTIVATSRLHHNHHDSVAPAATKVPSQQHHGHNHHDVIAVRADQFAPYGVVSVAEAVVDNVIGAGFYDDVVSMKDGEVVERVVEEEREKRVVEEEVMSKGREDISKVVERSTWTPPPSSPLRRQEKFSPEIFSEKPPASSRFGHHRRPAKAKPALAEGGKSLRVSKPKKHDTLESTWKAITEGRHIPLTRHLKKSDTWETHDRQIDLLDESFPMPAVVKKSETFHERSDYLPPPPQPLVTVNKLRKEPSLGQDELNRRVEAFINKFNEDM
uniref:DUF4408 domain-containing protein n=2 Tax=Chenopodium quinoa TaxID=63459 RepID=A0A803LPN1_CHEQI